MVKKEDELMPPVIGWQFYDEAKWFNNWTSDPTIECSRKENTVRNSHMNIHSFVQSNVFFFCFIFVLFVGSRDVNGFIWWLADCVGMGLRLVAGLILVIFLVIAVVVCRCLSPR